MQAAQAKHNCVSKEKNGSSRIRTPIFPQVSLLEKNLYAKNKN